MSAPVTEAPVTENPNPFKLSDYAVRTVKRVSAGVHLKLMELGQEGRNTVENIERIARDWEDDKTIFNFQQSYEALAIDAKRKGMSDNLPEIEKMQAVIDQKAVSMSNFKNSMRADPKVGGLIGAELLRRINYNPQYLDDPIILKGVEFILVRLEAEHLNNEEAKQRPDWDPAFLAFTDGTAAAIKEISAFREAVKQRQESNKSTV